MKTKKTMMYLLLFIALVIVIFIIGKINLSIQFSKQVKQLFAESKNISDRKFSYEQLKNLPKPVQKYFKHVMKEGQPYISNLRMTHDGQFKPGVDKDWVDIEGEEYFTAANPGFIWKGTTTMFTARDMYIGAKGNLVVSLFSLLTIVNAQGEQYNQGELIRWLGESILFQTNFLPSENLHWTPIDNLSAKLNYNYNGLSLFFIMRFNTNGEIIEMETKRYMDEKNLETWIIKLADYKRINQILIPTSFEVLWRLKKGDLSYAKFNLKKIEYNIPEKF